MMMNGLHGLQMNGYPIGLFASGRITAILQSIRLGSIANLVPNRTVFNFRRPPVR